MQIILLYIYPQRHHQVLISRQPRLSRRDQRNRPRLSSGDVLVGRDAPCSAITGEATVFVDKTYRADAGRSIQVHNIQHDTQGSTSSTYSDPHTTLSSTRASPSTIIVPANRITRSVRHVCHVSRLWLASTLILQPQPCRILLRP